MKSIITILIVLIFFSCRNNSETNFSNPKKRNDSISFDKNNISNNQNSNNKNIKINKDSIKIIGQQILNGADIWGNNEMYLFRFNG